MRPGMTIKRTDEPNGETTVEIVIRAPRREASNFELNAIFNAQKEGIPYVQEDSED